MPLLPKKFNGKMAEPLTPFFAAGLIVAWAVNAGANAMKDSDEFRFHQVRDIFPAGRGYRAAERGAVAANMELTRLFTHRQPECSKEQSSSGRTGEALIGF
ncbi:uncharacterized protein AB675_8397 [Cyphellophora attinorum]|uniref:Uncharacterized protein n=1 Tax=Cyphellophora attinorum TaxID=1664694 RepID=A0A0N1H9Y0_9EURO|nr:uncharacterized protein AB675_8397 [Phialophora attinorum]KPI44593.1 hypothetical protein AB675_8397 [Phialophora attinorum]